MPLKPLPVPSYRYHLSDGQFEAEETPVDSVPLSLKDSYKLDTARLVRFIAEQVASPFSPLALDVLDLACGVFLADCRSHRLIGTERGNAWRRQITLTVPVRDPHHWRQPQVGQALRQTLATITGDRWEFLFVRRTDAAPCTDGYLPFGQPVHVCLFSEGLDSLAGLLNRLVDDPDAHFIAVSAMIQLQTNGKIKDAVSTLNREFENRVRLVRVPLHRSHAPSPHREDPHQRSRSFFLVCTAAITALLTGAGRVEVFENGIEAFNFPFEEGLLNGQASRAMHPLFLARMTTLFTALRDAPLEFVEPFLFQTKGDMVRAITGKPGSKLIGKTISCMHFPQRKPGPKQCGRCEGCILRLMTLQGTAWGDVPNQYQENFGDPESIQCSEMRLRVYRAQVALQQPDAMKALLAWSGLNRNDRDELLSAAAQVGGVAARDVPDLVCALFARHGHEWGALQAAFSPEP